MGAGNLFGMLYYRNKVVSLKWCSHNQHIGAGLLHRMTISAWRYVHFCGLPFGLSIFLYLSLFVLPLTAPLSVLTFLFVAFSLSILAAFFCTVPVQISLYSPHALCLPFHSCLPTSGPRFLYLIVSISLSCVNYRHQRARWDIKGFFLCCFLCPWVTGCVNTLPVCALFEFYLCMPLKIFHYLFLLKNTHSTAASKIQGMVMIIFQVNPFVSLPPPTIIFQHFLKQTSSCAIIFIR